MFNLPGDLLELVESEGRFFADESTDDISSLNSEIADLLLASPSSSSRQQQQQSSLLRPFDVPSYRKHYGLITVFTHRIPILFRLTNHFYVPYVRFSYVLSILEHHQHHRHIPTLEMVQSLPVVEMTSIERTYYDQLVSALPVNVDTIVEQRLEWANHLLSVALLDCLIGIVDLAAHFHRTTDTIVTEWQEALEIMREIVKSRWSIDEKSVLNEVNKQTTTTGSTNNSDSTLISSTNTANRRSFFERRLELSIVEESGGFVQIESFVYPFVKCPLDGKIYLYLNDIRHSHHRLARLCIHHFPSYTSMSHAYNIVAKQARDNFVRNSIASNIFLSKHLPNPKVQDLDLNFIALDLFLVAQSSCCFVQLFSKVSLDSITSTYASQVARQLVMGNACRQGGLINGEIPFLRLRQQATYTTWIPTETKTHRSMSDDERLFINCILLYEGHWKMVLGKEQRWYLEEIDGDELSSTIELFDKAHCDRRQRELFVTLSQ